MKKIRQTLWGKEPFQILVTFFFSRLHDKRGPHFLTNFLKLAQIICSIIGINPNENEEKPSYSFGKKRHLKFLNFPIVYRSTCSHLQLEGGGANLGGSEKKKKK